MKFISKNSLKIFFTAILAGIFLMSCEDMNVRDLVGNNDVDAEAVAEAVEDAAARGSAEKRGRHRDGCFDLVYPVTVSLPDGTSATADSAEALHTILRDWKATGDTTGRPTLVFPLDVILEDGSTQTINNEAEFKEILADCGYGKKRRGKRGKHKRAKDCYELVFPITVSFPDSTTAVADSAGELKDLLHTWKRNDSTNLGRPTFVFPFDVVVLSDGSTVTITEKADLDAIRDACFREGRNTRCKNDSTQTGP